MTDRCQLVEPLLSAWLDRALRADEQVAVVTHLESCAACSDELERVRWVRSLARSLPVRRAPEGLLARAASQAAVAREDGDRAGRPIVRRAVATAAVLVGLLAGAAYNLGDAAGNLPRVRVPLDLYVADHVVHTVAGPVTTPVIAGPDR